MKNRTLRSIKLTKPVQLPRPRPAFDVPRTSARRRVVQRFRVSPRERVARMIALVFGVALMLTLAFTIAAGFALGLTFLLLH